MGAKLVVAPEAELDLAQAYVWYESSRVGLGEEFLSWVDACLEGIRRQPKMYAVVHEAYRRSLIRRFPYAVFYEYAETTPSTERSYNVRGIEKTDAEPAVVFRIPRHERQAVFNRRGRAHAVHNRERDTLLSCRGGQMSPPVVDGFGDCY